MEVGGSAAERERHNTVRVEEDGPEQEMDGRLTDSSTGGGSAREWKSAAVGLSAHWMAWMDGAWAGLLVGGPAAERTDGVNLPPNMQASARC
jgi:hypothetical protein